MPEPGRMDAERAAPLAGPAPAARRSGAWRGGSAIRGGRSACAGRARLRRALCMPALAAARFDPGLRARSAAMAAAGEPAKAAITAPMRRLGVPADALPRDDRAWTEAAA
jgi:transposase